MAPFRASPVPAASWWSRLLRRPHAEGAQAALENLLATTPPKEIHPARITKLLESYRLSGPAVRGLLKDLYRQAIQHFLQDRHLEPAELEHLQALRFALQLSEDEIIEIERETTHPRFQRRIQEMMSDGQLDPEERRELEVLHDHLAISPAVASVLRGEAVGKVLERHYREAMSDRRLTDHEMTVLNELAGAFGVHIVPDKATAEQFDRFALLWRIENGEFPEIPTDVNLGAGEVCHFQSSATLHEIRSRIRRVSYHGPTARIRIMKGVYYRLGSFEPSIVRDEHLEQVDSGTLYLTNKRLLYRGARKSSSIRLNKILAFRVAEDGLIVEKETGRHPHFQLVGDVELGAVVLGSLLARN